jgi:hypothetical protein
MDNESKFWISINAIVFTAIVSVVYFATEYWRDHNTKVVSLIESGVDPVAALCALQDDYGRNPTCIILAAKATKGE